jgi:polyphosphate kinase
VEQDGQQHIVFLDDVVKMHLHVLPDFWITGCYSFKVTRDAELNLDDEYEEDLAKKIERQIIKRDQGLATRFCMSPTCRPGPGTFFCKNLSWPKA